MWRDGVEQIEIMKSVFLTKTMSHKEDDDDIKERIDRLFANHGQEVGVIIVILHRRWLPLEAS